MSVERKGGDSRGFDTGLARFLCIKGLCYCKDHLNKKEIKSQLRCSPARTTVSWTGCSVWGEVRIQV